MGKLEKRKFVNEKMSCFRNVVAGEGPFLPASAHVKRENSVIIGLLRQNVNEICFYCELIYYNK